MSDADKALFEEQRCATLGIMQAMCAMVAELAERHLVERFCRRGS
jgi:hypothetical protein